MSAAASGTLSLDTLLQAQRNIESLVSVPGRLDFIESSLLVNGPFEDWSQCRSPSRAKRRMKRGHKQRVRYYHLPDPSLMQIGNKVMGHPATINQLRRAIGQSVRATYEDNFYRGIGS